MYANFNYPVYSVASLFLLAVALFLCCTCSVPVVLLKHQVIKHTWHSNVLIVENAAFFGVAYIHVIFCVCLIMGLCLVFVLPP